MNKVTLLDTAFAQAHALGKMLQPTLVFLSKNLNVIVPKLSVDRDLNSIRPWSETPISMLYTKAVQTGKLGAFSFLNLKDIKGDIPVLLTLNDVTINGKAITTTPVPAQLQNCWINLTPIVSRSSAYNDAIQISNQIELYELVARAICCAGYDTNNQWINERHAAYMCDTYSAIVTNYFSGFYHFNVEEAMMFRTLFAAYFCQLLGRQDSPLDVPPLLMTHCNFLGTNTDIIAVLERVKPYRPNNGDSLLTPPTICNCLRHVGPERMKDFDETEFYRGITSSNVDSSSTAIALDYPPYWLWQLLRVASGHKNWLISSYLKITNTKAKLDLFCKDIVSSNVLITKV